MADLLPFRRIAIVNRGEPAMRLINAVRELRLELGADLTTIALFTDADRRAMFVREADEAHELGPASYNDGGGERRVGYLDYDRLEAALMSTSADAAWVGWGFVAEHARFADLCADLGVTFIGPSGDVMRLLGDKITSKHVAEQAGVPVVPWSGGPVETLDAAHASATQLGYPLMIKSTAGGGGRGIRRVIAPNELATAFDRARAEAASAFGDGTVFLEKAVAAARHVEVQIVGDHHGTVWPVGVRDCTVQRRNQKIIEEAPSPVLSDDQHDRLLRAAADIARAAGYRNAGTVEFLFDPKSGQSWFLEVNARLQVEHPITELTTGLDLVKLQLLVAAGAPLPGAPPGTTGHAIEVRLNAEDPGAGFAPAPGRLDLLRFPVGPGIRVDTGIEEGDLIAPEFDSMIAKIMAYGRTRDEALSRLRRGLSQTFVVVSEGATNKAFVESLLAHPAFATADFDVGWVDRLTSDTTHGESNVANLAIVTAAIAAYDEEAAIDRRSFKESANRGRPQVDATIGKTIGLRYRGSRYEARTMMLAPGRHAVEVGGQIVDAVVEHPDRPLQRLQVNGQSHRVLSVVEGGTHFVEIDGVPHRILHDEGGLIRAPSPAVVVTVAVGVGDEVHRGERLAVIEAMKMETVITAPFSGRVREVLVLENTQVGTGAPLMIVEPQDTEEEAWPGQVDFAPIAAHAEVGHLGCEHWLATIEQMILGYDIDPATVEAETGLVRQCTDDIDVGLLQMRENEILEAFVAIISLFRRDPIDDEYADITRRSSEEYLFSYLRDTASTEALPERFRRRLHNAVALYGVSENDDTEVLDAALYRIAKSHDRMDAQVPAILAILDHRLEIPGSSDDGAFREVLDRIISQTQGRYPAVHDLAREVYYTVFDQPFLSETRQRTYQEAEERLVLLLASPSGAARERLVHELVECPQPLTPLLSGRFRPGQQEANCALLEVMVRRYYRIRGLHRVVTTTVDGFSAVTADYERDGRTIHLVALHAIHPKIAQGAAAIAKVVASIGTVDDVVAELFVWREASTGSIEDTRDEFLAILRRALGEQHMRRVVVSVSSPESGRGIAGVLNLTFRPDGEGGYREETLYRDLHPMMGKRLQLSRLDAFDLQRLTTLEDVYLFRGVAKHNPRDERLFALAEVRDLTPIRNENGEVTRLPEFERMFRDVLGAIRRYQAHRPAGRRLDYNRVLLHAWPVLELTREEIRGLVGRLAPDTEGIGLQSVEIAFRIRTPGTGKLVPSTLEFSNPGGQQVGVRLRRTRSDPIQPLSAMEQEIVRLRRRGLFHPADIVELLTRRSETRAAAHRGTFIEYDLADGNLQPVDRAMGKNTANIVVGVVSNPTPTYPEGMRRVILIGDPSRGMGSLAKAECLRIIAGLDLAAEESIPLEWFAVSAGALISMDSGTENMDWIGSVLRRLVEYTQVGGEVNIVVTGVNVGAQPYWNAEATMLMHTKGILVMTPDSAMVLTGKQALDYSGGVSAEDNRGIGGYERIMGPNGQAQYFARGVADACHILLRHYDYTYVAPGERFPRRAESDDPMARNVEEAPHGGDFALVGDVFAEESNPGRKRPFDIRRVMAAVVDRDHPTLERWYGMLHAEVAVVWDARIGGYATCLLGFESMPIKRAGFVPADGPDQWTSGTLFPVASKKVARAINAASGNRPLVVLANLSGFDGSPESMRNLQLEYGAEIGRAVVNFRGPIVFCVISRYHGGAFVVFSNRLHDNLEIAALEGSHASVIGGAPAAAVVFARDVQRRTDEDPRVVQLSKEVGDAAGSEKSRLRTRLERLRDEVYAVKLGEVADEFDAVHNVDRALEVGSIHRIIPPSQLRPYVVDAIERGMARELARWANR